MISEHFGDCRQFVRSFVGSFVWKLLQHSHQFIIASNEFGLIWFCWRLNTVSTTATMNNMFFHCRMLVGRGNMRLMECLHTFSQRSQIKNESNIFSALLTCVSKHNSMVFFIKNKRLFSIERKKKNCRLDCVCRLTFYPVDGEKSTIYVYLIKRWDAPANGTCCQRVFGAHCARCSQHTQKTT